MSVGIARALDLVFHYNKGAPFPFPDGLAGLRKLALDSRYAPINSSMTPCSVRSIAVWLARPAGFEPATRCLEGTVGASLDVAWRRSTSHLPADTVAGRRRASCEICLRWLPGWLPEIYLLSLKFEETKIESIAWCFGARPASLVIHHVTLCHRRPREIARRADVREWSFALV
jgi:hypothetical protein